MPTVRSYGAPPQNAQPSQDRDISLIKTAKAEFDSKGCIVFVCEEVSGGTALRTDRSTVGALTTASDHPIDVQKRERFAILARGDRVGDDGVAKAAVNPLWLGLTGKQSQDKLLPEPIPTDGMVEMPYMIGMGSFREDWRRLDRFFQWRDGHWTWTDRRAE